MMNARILDEFSARVGDLSEGLRVGAATNDDPNAVNMRAGGEREMEWVDSFRCQIGLNKK